MLTLGSAACDSLLRKGVLMLSGVLRAGPISQNSTVFVPAYWKAFLCLVDFGLKFAFSEANSPPDNGPLSQGWRDLCTARTSHLAESARHWRRLIPRLVAASLKGYRRGHGTATFSLCSGFLIYYHTNNFLCCIQTRNVERKKKQWKTQELAKVLDRHFLKFYKLVKIPSVISP